MGWLFRMLSASSVCGAPQKNGQARAASFSMCFPPRDMPSNVLIVLGDLLRMRSGCGRRHQHLPSFSFISNYTHRKKEGRWFNKSMSRISFSVSQVVAKRADTEPIQTADLLCGLKEVAELPFPPPVKWD